MSSSKTQARPDDVAGSGARHGKASRELGAVGLAIDPTASRLEQLAAPLAGRRALAVLLPSRSSIIGISVLMVVTALALGSTLSVATADASFRDDVMARYLLPVRHLYDSLQRAALLGIDVARAPGVRREIARSHENLKKVADRSGKVASEPSISLIGPRGQVLHVIGPPGQVISDSFIKAISLPNHDGGVAQGRHFVDADGVGLLAFRIVDAKDEWAATIVASVDSRWVDEWRAQLRAQAIRSCTATLTVAILFFVLLLTIIFDADSGNLPRTAKRALWASAVFALVAQLAAIDVVLKPYREAYPETIAEKSRTLSGIVQTDLAPALNRGAAMEYMDFRHFDWDRLLAVFPEAEGLAIFSARGVEVVRISETDHLHLLNEKLRPVKKADDWGWLKGTPRVLSTPLDNDGGRIDLTVLEENLTTHMLDVGADAFAATMVALLVLLEFLLLYHLLLRPKTSTAPAPTMAAGLIRPAAFLFVFGIDLPMSFVPLHTERLNSDASWFSPEVMMGLPISAEFLLVGVAILAAGPWVDRRGWRPAFVTGIVLASAGSCYSWAASDVLHFIISRGVLGAGYGLVLIASQAYVVRRSAQRDTAASLAQLFAGIYAGSICGGVAGAMLAERLGFASVFLLGAAVTAAVLVYTALLLPQNVDEDAPQARDPSPAKAPAAAASGAVRSRMANFLSNRCVLALILASSLPASMSAVGFINYFSPIHLNALGVSQSSIGQILMLYGVCLVFLGPMVSRSVHDPESQKNAILAGTLLGGIALVTFSVLDGVAAMVAVVILLGMSHSLVLSAQGAYLLSLHVAKDLGTGVAVSIFRATGRIGQFLGPAVFVGATLAASPSQWFIRLGFVYVICAAAFWLATRRDSNLVEAPA